MRTDANVANGDPGKDGLSRESPTVAQLVELFRAAQPITWEQLLPKRLATLGVARPEDLTPAKLAKFKDQVFRSANQNGIKDPDGWISQRAELETEAAAPDLRCPAQGRDTAAPQKSAEREPVAIRPARASAASVSPPMPRSALFGKTKAEVLSRARAAVEAGASRRHIAEMLACAQEDFHASQREIGRAIGRSASTVNRLLKWRLSGYKQPSPFGPTTRAGRAAHRNASNIDPGGRGRAEQIEDDGTVRSVEHCSPPSRRASPPAPLNENLPGGSTQAEPPVDEAATRETKGHESQAVPIASGSLHLKKQKLPAGSSKIGRRLSPEGMLIVIEALRECPLLARAAAKAGLHRKSLEYRLKRSKAGQDGYDIEWEGHHWRFHEACAAAIDEAHQRLLDTVLRSGLGPHYL